MNPKRILFSTWGSLGDLHPYLALAVELQRRGHHATMATLSAWREQVERTGVTFQAAGPDIPADGPVAREMVRRILDPRHGPQYLFEEVLGPRMRESYDALLAAVQAAGGADLLVTHQIPFTGPIVAEMTGVPWVSGIVQPMAFLSVFDPPTPPQAPWLRPILAFHPQIARMLTGIARRLTNSWMAPVYRFRQTLGLPAGQSPIFESQHSPRLVLALFSRLLGAKQADYPAQTIVTGFPFYDGAAEHPPAPELQQFLADGEPPLLFTLGSSAVWIAGDFYQASIDAALKLGKRALLLAGEDAARLRAQPLPSSIMIANYAPHSLVMPQAALTVHQGGVGTTGQALRAGRPMMVVPFGQDQPDNARRCEALGVSRTLSRRAYSPDRIARELSRLLEQPSYTTRAAEVGEMIGAEQGTVTACDAIEEVLRGAQRPA